MDENNFDDSLLNILSKPMRGKNNQNIYKYIGNKPFRKRFKVEYTIYNVGGKFLVICTTNLYRKNTDLN